MVNLGQLTWKKWPKKMQEREGKGEKGDCLYM